jgi:hypothetical protein
VATLVLCYLVSQQGEESDVNQLPVELSVDLALSNQRHWPTKTSSAGDDQVLIFDSQSGHPKEADTKSQ